MLYIHVLTLSTLALCLAEEGKRDARNPGLLHLSHAGQSVGSYVLAGPRAAGAGVAAGHGGGGPHIVIVGGQPAHVSTHVAGRDSLEELDEDLRQHYGQQQGDEYNADPVRQQLAYSALKDLQAGRFRAFAPSQDHNGAAGAAGYGGGHVGVGYRIAPVLVNQQPLGHPQQGQAYSSQQISSISSHPVQTHQGAHYRVSDGAQHSATPATTNYAPPPHFSPTPAPLSHTVATPVIHTLLPARVPLHHSLQSHRFQAVPYHAALAQRAVFIPIRTVAGHQPQFQSARFATGHNPNGEYSPSLLAGTHQRSLAGYGEERRPNTADAPHNYENAQERRPVTQYQSQIHQRDFDGSDPAQYRQGSTEFDKSYKYGSDEVLAKSAGTPSVAYRSGYTPEDKASPSQDDVSAEAGSEEQNSPGAYKYSFADDHRTDGRSYSGDGKVATSYQSVTLETNDQSPAYYKQNQH